jgi:hypothetical protein
VIAKELLMGRQADEETPEAKAAREKAAENGKAPEAEKETATAEQRSAITPSASAPATRGARRFGKDVLADRTYE